MTQKGLFVVIDGTDGSGKKTQTKLLVERLQNDWYAVEKIDFPQYGTKSAWLVEEYLNGKYGGADDVNPYQASIFYAVDRYDASFQIRKRLEEGKIVISDRYTSANMGHQAGKIDDIKEREKYLVWLEELEFGILNIPRPDANIFLYMDSEVARKLALQNQKGANLSSEKDIHENDGEHMKKASEAFKYVAKKYSWKTVICWDWEWNFKSREVIHEEIFSVVLWKL